MEALTALMEEVRSARERSDSDQEKPSDWERERGLVEWPACLGDEERNVNAGGDEKGVMG